MALERLTPHLGGMLTPLCLLLAQASITGIVFVDRNANGRRDPGEAGLPEVAISDQVDVVTSDGSGAFRLSASSGFGIVFVSVPTGYRAVGPFWRSATDTALAFPLAPAPAAADVVFVHASDTHISPATVGRTRRLRALLDSLRPDFAIISGDLVRDALRVGEAEATGYYELFEAEARQIRVPVWTVPGNHEIFGIERGQSHVSPDHPLYGRAMYRRYRGPDYYSFNYGGIHFVGLNSVDIDDQWYYGHVDSVQGAWLARDLAVVPATTPVVTFNHIPFFTAVETINGYLDDPPAPTAITVRGKTSFRHAVANAGAILALVRPHPYPLALGGHMHVRERLRYEGVPTRFELAAAVVGPSEASGLGFPSGVTLYRVHGGRIDEGRFVPLDPSP
jgi:predicted MPP superfamily phosphohydrolase